MISDTTTSARYIVTNGVLGYSIPFRIYTEADVAVFWSADARADTQLTLGTHYTVTILTEGGMVNLLPGVVPVGSRLAVVSNIPATQEADFSSTSTISTDALETQLDRQVQMIQQLEDSVARSVVLPVTSSETPQEVVQDIYTARDEAEAAASAAAVSETAAATSATKSAAHSLLAEQSRGHACQCADRAEQARDVAMQQAEAINVVMATEMDKINTIIATNKDDQTAAITASRAWSETDEDVPVDTDGEGNPEYSSKHWAMKSAQLLAGNASTTHKGVMQVGSGLDVSEGVVSVKSTATPTPDAVPKSDANGDLWGLAKKNMTNLTQAGTTAIAHYASPSLTRRIAISMPASGDRLPAMPFDGTLSFTGVSTASNQSVSFSEPTSHRAFAPITNWTVMLSCKVQKGATPLVSYSILGQKELFLIPDEGAY